MSEQEFQKRWVASTLDKLKENYFIALDFIQSKKLEQEFCAYYDFVTCNKTNTTEKEQ